jgi:long-chain acyl-CoA synthetase
MSRPPASYQPISIASGVRAAAARTPGKIALRDGERTLTYAALYDRIQRVTGAVRDGLGLKRGDNVAILAPNCLEFVEIVFGASSAGVAVATLNPRLVAREMAFICDDCGAKALFVHPSLEETVRAIEFQTVTTIIVLDGGYGDWLGKARPLAEQPFEEWDAFAIPYTSGTTGKPKGVVLSHRSRVTTFFALASEYGCYAPDDRYLATAPLFHGAGFAFAMGALFFGGYCEVLPAFEPEQVIAKLHAENLTGTFMVPTHFHAIFTLENAVLDKYRRPDVRSIVSNAAPLPQATKERIVDYFGDGILHETYGSTEGGIVTNLRPADQLRKIKCVGLPFVATRVELRGKDGAVAAPGEVGELFSTSPFLFNGYWRRPEETEATLQDGWVTAGDLAVRDEEGFVYLVDRKSDMIISGGVNIYPREIEEILYRHEAVAEAAVIGAPDERWGEAVVAYVVTRPGESLDGETVIAYCKEHLASHKAPKSVTFLEALPKNAAGKVLKRELRERL